MMRFTGLLRLAVMLPLVVARSVHAGDELKAPDASPLHEQVLEVSGDTARPVTLQVTLHTSPEPGPFPLAVMNHGSARNVPARKQPRYHPTFSAYYFLSRGYAVALPMMRGFAGSGGVFVGHGCDDVQVA